MFDCIVIGNGPAGISAAIYLKRFNLNVLVIGKDLGVLEKNSVIENYYGIKKINGGDLIHQGIEQAKSLGIDVLRNEVLSIKKEDCFLVSTKDFVYKSKTVFLACGKPRNKPQIRGISEFSGLGVSFCAICDGFLYRKKRIALIGSGDYMKSELEVLKRFSNDIIIFTNGENCDVDGVVVTEKIVELYGDSKIRGIKTVNEQFEVDACFVAIGSANGASFAAHLGILLDEKEFIVVNNYQTNIEGLFAGGDVIGGLMQIVKAANDGAQAAIEINKYLKK